MLLSFAAALAVLAASGAPRQPSVADIDAAVRRELQRQKVPGLALAVVQRGKVVATRAYGLANVEHQVPVTAETIFQSGSVGKQFTAAVVMLLVEDGKISLDDPVVRYFPEAASVWPGITVRHLLTHTSGIPEYPDDFDLQRDYTDDDLVKYAMGLKLEFEPGARWSYSNVGYALLGFLVRRGSGQFYGDILRDRVFKPAGMTTARVISEADIVPHRAAGYRLHDGVLENQEWVSPSLNRTADGALYLTIRDFAAWDLAVRRGAVLKAQSWTEVFSPVALRSGRTYPYGFGWFVDHDLGPTRVHHGGGWQGFKAYISRYLGDDLSIMVLMNLEGAEPEAFVDVVAALYDPALVLSNAPTQPFEPPLDARLRDLLERTGNGSLVADDFPLAWAGYFPRTPAGYRKLVEPRGRLVQLRLIRRLERGDDVSYRFRALFEKGSLEAAIKIGPDGRVGNFYLWESASGP